jgi:hypothetical protein
MDDVMDNKLANFNLYCFSSLKIGIIVIRSLQITYRSDYKAWP